jgi:hypothetical protein
VKLRLANCLRYLYLANFSKPVRDRVLFRAIRQTRARKILEIGIGDTARSLRMIGLAKGLARGEPVRYAAIDLFEARAAASGRRLPLKEVHCLLTTTQAQIQLIPGDPPSALGRSANSLPNVDMIVISTQFSAAALSEAWFFVPRMLHAGTVVFRENAGTDGMASLQLVEHAEIQSLAGASRRRAA